MIATQESLKKLITVPSEQQAAIIVAALLDEGIDACYMGETTANFRVGVPGKLHVYVSETELDHAHQVLEERESATVETQGVDVDEAEAADGRIWKSLVLIVLFLFLLTGIGGTGR